MPTALLSPSAKQQFFTNGSEVAAGYRLYIYLANTLTPGVTYVNRAGTVENEQPIILDARGEAIIYLTPGVVYDYVLKTPEDAPVWTREDVSADAGDANAVSFTQAGTGAIQRSSQDKMREIVSPEDFGAVGDGVADDTLAIQAALNTGKQVRLLARQYKTTATLYIPAGSGLLGMGYSNWNFRSSGTWIVSTASPVIQVGEGGNFIYGTSIQNLNIRRSGFVEGAAVAGIGILYWSGFHNTVCDVYIEGFSTGIKLGDSASSFTGLGFDFYNTFVAGCDVCVHVEKAAQVYFNGGRLGLNGTDAVRACAVKLSGYVDTTHFKSVIIANNSGFTRNVWFTTPATSLFWVVFNDCDIETGGAASVDIATSVATFIHIDNCWVGSPAPLIVSAGGRITISNNTFSNQTAANRSIWLQGGNRIDVTNNDFTSSPSFQVDIGNATGVKVIGNNMEQGTTAINIAPPSAAASGDHIITGNYLTGQGNNSISVMANAGLKGLIISGNRISSFVNHGIIVDGAGPAKCNYTITGNSIATQVGAGTRRGISITNAGINYYVITANDTSDCVTAPINDAGGANKVVANNLA